MKLYIGGVGQGKLACVKRQYGILEEEIWDGAVEKELPPAGIRVVYHLERWFWNRLQEEAEPEKIVREWTKLYPYLIYICDEVGNGIVPIDKQEREYRERLGRLLCEIASEAEQVERVFCGIAQRIK